jgi:t-SNARE complex subunit (syntaxin)
MERGAAMRRGGLILMLGVSAACVRTAPLPRQSEAMERSARILRQLDKLEADLHQGQAEIATYGELVDRHNRAEQIACKVTDEHVEEIHRLAMAQQQKIEQKRQHKKKAIAMARTPASKRAFAVR